MRRSRIKVWPPPKCVILGVNFSFSFYFAWAFLKCKYSFFFHQLGERTAVRQLCKWNKNRLPCVELFKLWAAGLMNYKSVSPFCWQNANLFMTLRLKENEIIIYFQMLVQCFRLGGIYLGWKDILWINCSNSLLKQLDTKILPGFRLTIESFGLQRVQGISMTDNLNLRVRRDIFDSCESGEVYFESKTQNQL